MKWINHLDKCCLEIVVPVVMQSINWSIIMAILAIILCSILGCVQREFPKNAKQLVIKNGIEIFCKGLGIKIHNIIVRL
jgi:hypothetical protein